MIVVSVVSICAVILALQFKQSKPEYGIYISIACCILVFAMGLSYVADIVQAISQFSQLSSISNDYIKILLKIAGVSFICEISADIAVDCGYKAIANYLQIFGKITVLVISLPVFVKLINSIGNLLT